MIHHRRMLLACLLMCPLHAALHSYPGSTPHLDGVLSAGEWSDATRFTGTANWTSTFTPTTDPKDLSVQGWVKHDSTHLYFAFDVTDDVLYGIDTPRWLPDENALAHELTPKGFPWFGDEIEILINAGGTWQAHESAAGSGSSWQMVCNLTKSRKGGIGTGGLLEGEPRSSQTAWDTYRQWIESGAQDAVAKAKPAGHGYIVEWAIRFNPCLEVAPGRFYNPTKNATVGLNIAVGDLDRKEDGKGNFGNFHHEDWLSGKPKTRTELRDFTTLTLHARR
jgi:SSS family solute:Na+ symporter